MENNPLVIQGVAITKKEGCGRPKGSGCNLKLLDRITPGEAQSCIAGCSRSKMNSIRVSAQNAGIKIKVRKWPDGYAIWRIT